MKLKVAVYTISKNESKNAERWAECCREADYRVVTDTGSTDGTVEILEKAGVTVHTAEVFPWRFDVSRNISLQNVPLDADCCVSLDMDEVLVPGWKEALLRDWKPGTTRLRYLDIRQWRGDQKTPSEAKYTSKIHSRQGYQWKYAIHECLMPVKDFRESVVTSRDLRVYHFQDKSKNRDLYFDLLKKLVVDEPEEVRYHYYLAHEWIRRENHQEAMTLLKHYLKFEDRVYHHERAMALRLIAFCLKNQGADPSEVKRYLLKSAAESPAERENWANLAIFMAEQRDWPECFAYASQGLKINDQKNSFFIDPQIWGPALDQLYFVSARHLGIPQHVLKRHRITDTKGPLES